LPGRRGAVDNPLALNAPVQKTRFHALVPAAGTGSRLGQGVPKQYLPLAGVPLLQHALSTLAGHAEIATVHVVLAPDDDRFDRDIADVVRAKVIPVRCGGDSRAASVLNGLRAMRPSVAEDDWVLVHDAARPCLSGALLDRLLRALETDTAGGILALPVADTLKAADEDRRIVRTVDRSGLWQAQTPQMFRFRILERALAEADVAAVTDEASAVEALGLQPRLVEGDATNLKVTYARDMILAELILRQRAGTATR
jgi:2-C-methyl-D-erythritol 4-phosphate cytidylyltransferase